MSGDPRLTLAYDGLAAAGLEGVVEATTFAPTVALRCVAASAAIRKTRDPLSEQQDQLLFGEAFEVLLREDGFVFGQARRDCYVGWAPADAFADGALVPSHWVSAPRTLAFAAPDIKSAPTLSLSRNTLLKVDERDGRFARVRDAGWVFEGHIAPIETYAADPVAQAADYAGAVYLWGGREADGLDCSGLVQQAHYACAIPTARDSDMQLALGRPVDQTDLARGDLVFWKGHVGVMADKDTVLHANAYHMAVEREPLIRAMRRIAAAGGGEPVGFRRV